MSPATRRRQERILAFVLVALGGAVTLGWFAFLAWVVLGPLWRLIVG